MSLMNRLGLGMMILFAAPPAEQMSDMDIAFLFIGYVLLVISWKKEP